MKQAVELFYNIPMNLEAIIIGSVTGFISAFFGIGGSSIDTPSAKDIPSPASLHCPGNSHALDHSDRRNRIIYL